MLHSDRRVADASSTATALPRSPAASFRNFRFGRRLQAGVSRQLSNAQQEAYVSPPAGAGLRNIWRSWPMSPALSPPGAGFFGAVQHKLTAVSVAAVSSVSSRRLAIKRNALFVIQRKNTRYRIIPDPYGLFFLSYLYPPISFRVWFGSAQSVTQRQSRRRDRPGAVVSTTLVLILAFLYRSTAPQKALSRGLTVCRSILARTRGLRR